MSYYEEQAAACRLQAACLRILIDCAGKAPAVAQALANLDPTRMGGALSKGRLAFTELRAELADEEAATARFDRLAEMERRAAEAGVPTAGRCGCGCGALKHGELTDDGRLPCTTAGCPCDDLDFAKVTDPTAPAT